MKRKDFLKGVGLSGIGLSLPNANLSAKPQTTGDCVLIPTETAGPFPLDLNENDFFFRQDIREGEEGVPLDLKLKILGLDNCGPMANVRVNIWHCTKDGVYTGYNTGSNPGDVDATALRGYQFTDANGEVDFLTIFPGWYPGRVCHIHIQVFVSSAYSAVSQFAFPDDKKNELYNNNLEVYTKGLDPLSLNTDGAFVDDHQYQVATLEQDAVTGSYASYLEITVQGTGTSGIGHLERETAKVFEVGQNYPNPYRDKTVVPINLKEAAELSLELWDLSGRKVATVVKERRGIGQYEISISPAQYGLSAGNYLYQVVADTGNGIFRLPKMMTAQQ